MRSQGLISQQCADYSLLKTNKQTKSDCRYAVASNELSQPQNVGKKKAPEEEQIGRETVSQGGEKKKEKENKLHSK